MRSNVIKNLLSLAAVGLLVFVAAAEGLVICPACSHESAGGNFCGHCGAALAKDAPASAAVAPSNGVAEAAAAAQAPAAADPTAAIVDEDLARASATSLATPEGAAFVLAALGNAKAVYAACPSPAVPEAQRRKIHAGIAAARAALVTTRIACPRCAGKGQEDDVRELAALDGKTVTMKAGRVTCRRCGGGGTVVRIRSAVELRAILAAGRQRFAEAALLAGRVRSGNAWIAPEMDAAATTKGRASLRRNSADPCPDCAGFGRAGCDECGGTGMVKCDNRECKNGRIDNNPQTQTADTQGRIAAAQGPRFTPCPDCKGLGETACAVCAGTGAAACATCKGSGERKPCARCHGEGSALCRECRGTGQAKKGGPCLICKGEGLVICTSCGGDGHGN